MKKGKLKKVITGGAMAAFCTLLLSTSMAEFKDLRPDHWCYEKITDFTKRGYVKGYEDGEFKADKTITRAEYVTIVNNFFGYDAKGSDMLEFSDVSKDDWFAPYVSEAVKRGYISGYPDGTFRPYEPIRRQEATVILSKILNIHDEDYDKDHEDGLAQYADGENVDEWAYKAVHNYSIYNFINGYEDNTIRLFNNVTRAETVQLLNTVEQKVIIDRDNKTNEVTYKPSGGSVKRVKTPVISVVEVNDDNEWYNGVEAEEDNKVTVKVSTSTDDATIEVKVNGETIETEKVEVESGSEVKFELPDGKYEIIATATRNKYKNSSKATLDVNIDTEAPVVSGKINKDDNIVELHASDSLSGIDENDGIQYAWFVKENNNYKRISNWEDISDKVDFPTEPQNYYIGVKGSDIAGNKINGGLIDNNVSDKVTDEVANEEYDVVKEIVVNDGTDKEPIQVIDDSMSDKFIIFHKNDGTERTYKQYMELEGNTTLETDIFSREEYKFIGWAETSDGVKAYEDGAEVNFNDNKDLYAIWELNEISDKPVVVEVKVNLTFVSDENGVIEGMSQLEVAYGTEWSNISIPTPKPNPGYRFASWNPVLPSDETLIIADGTYTANYVKDDGQSKEISYTVEYYKDGVHVEEDDVEVKKNVWINETEISVEEANKSNDKYSGYKFSHTEPTEIPQTIGNGGVIKVYYVKDNEQEKEIGYTVQYYIDGRHMFEDDVEVSRKVWINETEIEVEKVNKANDKYSGYKYSHTDPTEIPETMSDGEIIKVYYVKDSEQVKEISYTVEYYKDGVHVEADDVEIKKNIWVNENEIEVEEVNKSNDKYSGYKYSHTDPTEVPETMSDGGVIKVYYVSKTYDVIYDANGGASAPNSQLKEDGVDLKLTMSIPENDGYSFEEWNTTADGTGESYMPGDFYKIDNTVTLYAQWRKIVGLEVEIICEYPTEEGLKAEPGDIVKYELALNAETDNVTLPVVVKIQLDSNVELDIDSLPSNAAYDSENNVINWNVSNIDDELVYEVTVKSSTPAGSEIITKIIEGATADDHVMDVEETVVVKQNKDKNIVLVLDVSGSMEYCVNHGSTFRNNLITGKRGHGIGLGFYQCSAQTRLDELKDSAKEFIENICNEKGTEDITITIITFANNAVSKGTVKNPDISQLETIIDDLSADGGTNMRGGIRAATTVLNGEDMLPNAVNSVVVLSDGDPEHEEYYCDNNTLREFRETNANVYAIGFGDSYLEDELLNIVDNDSTKLFDAADGEELNLAFEKIGYELNKTQTTEGVIEVDISGITVYPIKLHYKDNEDREIEVIDETELIANNLSISENKLIWDISKYPGCSEFEMQVNMELKVALMRTMSFMSISRGIIEDEILDYGDPNITDYEEIIEEEIVEEEVIEEEIVEEEVIEEEAVEEEAVEEEAIEEEVIEEEIIEEEIIEEEIIEEEVVEEEVVEEEVVEEEIIEEEIIEEEVVEEEVVEEEVIRVEQN